MRTVFIHTNPKQHVGAVVAAHALRRNSRHPERFAVEILSTDDFPMLQAYEGRAYTYGGSPRTWRNDDLQSFTPLRFAPPARMRYAGRAVVIDPDVFAVGDVNALLEHDMDGKASMCARRPPKPHRAGYLASSVMLLDCAKLRHWQPERDFAAMFDGNRDYEAWIKLELEPPGSIGILEPEWNHFDTLTERTQLLHNTRRRTQPWKTGLPVDFQIHAPLFGVVPQSLIRSLRRLSPFPDAYQPHPDPRQTALFFALLRECLELKLISEERLRDEIARRHIRPDVFTLLDQTPSASAREPLAHTAAS